MAKRIIAVVLSLILVVALVGCGGSKRQPIEVTLSTEDAEAILAAAGIRLPDASETPAAGTNVKWYAWYDPFQNYSEDEIVNTGFFTFKEKYGSTLEYVECTWDERFTKLANLLVGGTPPDVYPGDLETFPFYAVGRKMFSPVDDYIDYDDILWSDMKEFADNYVSIGGRHYMMVTDVKLDYVCGYNRRVINEWGFDDPAELFYNGEWDSDEWLDMCISFSDADEERYAVDGWYYDVALMYMSGTPIVSYNPETGLFQQNIDNPGLERAANVIEEMKRNDCIFPVWKNGWKLRGGEEIQGIGVKDGLTLFFVVGIWGMEATVDDMATRWGDMLDEEVMFVPMPKDSQGDGNYYVTAKTDGFCIVKGAANPEGVALLGACSRFRIIDPTVMSVDRKQKVEKYLWTDEMLAMYDTVIEMAKGPNALVDYGEGLGGDLSTAVAKFNNLGRQSTSSSWAQVKEANADVLQYQVDLFNETVREYEAELAAEK